MTDINKPVARPTETLVHLHFIDPDTQDRSTWIGESVSRGLRRSPAGRLVLDVAVDVGSAPESDAADTESAAHRLQALIDQAAQDGEVGDATPIFDVAGYSATFGDLREVLATARLADRLMSGLERVQREVAALLHFDANESAPPDDERWAQSLYELNEFVTDTYVRLENAYAAAQGDPHALRAVGGVR